MQQVLFFILFWINICGYCQKSDQSFSNIILLDIKGKEFAFSDSIYKPAIILYYSEPNCHGCIDEIVALISQKKVKNFYVIAQDRNDIMYRKQVVKRFSEITSSVKAVYFDNNKLNFPFQTTISAKKKSPWLIFYSNKLEVFANDDIFDSSSSNLKFIKTFLKKLAFFVKQS